MSYNIIPTGKFGKELKRLVKKFPSLKSEFSELIEKILHNPETGIFISNNCYKIRLSISSKGKGKSGGARVITYLYIETETVYLLTIYDKGEKADLKPNELKEMIDSLQLNL
jgi:mRNA-degrading endonuclease RelE of RelBE toxin-antitoxin system